MPPKSTESETQQINNDIYKIHNFITKTNTEEIYYSSSDYGDTKYPKIIIPSNFLNLKYRIKVLCPFASNRYLISLYKDDILDEDNVIFEYKIYPMFPNQYHLIESSISVTNNSKVKLNIINKELTFNSINFIKISFKLNNIRYIIKIRKFTRTIINIELLQINNEKVLIFPQPEIFKNKLNEILDNIIGDPVNYNDDNYSNLLYLKISFSFLKDSNQDLTFKEQIDKINYFILQF